MIENNHKIIRDYTPLLNDLKKLSMRHNICCPRISYIGYWDPNDSLDGFYTISQYGVIEFRDKCNCHK